MRHDHGFTLIELLVTLSVAAILLGLAVPSFVSFQRNSELTSTANAFVAAVAAGRAEAMKRQRSAFVEPASGNAWGNGWIVYVDMNNDMSYAAGTDLLIAKSASVVSTVTVSNGFSDGGSLYLRFNGSGFMVTKANATAFAGALDFRSVSGEVRRILADPTGRLRVCKPSEAGCSPNVF